MPVDPYAPCPCGSGKKVKFCCADLVGEIEKIHRMLEGEQYAACLAFIERLTEKHADRASLLAPKAMLETSLGKTEQAQATLDRFLAKEPDNPIALAEQAILTSRTAGGRAAVPFLQRALEHAGERVQSRVYEAIGAVGAALLAEGDIYAARTHLLLQAALAGDEDPRPMRLLIRINSAPEVPLPLKDELALGDAPDDAPWKDSFDQAMQAGRGLAQSTTAEALKAVVEQHPDAAAAWRNLGLLLAGLADPAAAGALRTYASLDVPLDDAVEAEMLAQLLDQAALAESEAAEMLDVVKFSYPAADAQPLLAALLDSPITTPLPIEAAALQAEEGPPPQALYWLLDRPLPASGADLTLETAPLVLGRLYLFGRQTDREARLELIATDNDQLAAAQQALRDLAGDLLGAPGEREVVSQVPALTDALSWKWRLPDDTPAEVRRDLVQRRRHQIMYHEWPDLKQPALGGKSVREVAADPSGTVRALAAILLFDLNSADDPHVDFNQLRRQLNLPVAESVDPTGLDMETFPLVRMTRLETGKLTDEQLLTAYRRAVFATARQAIRPLAQEVIGRESMTGKVSKEEAYSLLVQFESDPAEALRMIASARRAAEEEGESIARWDLAEFDLQLEVGNGPQAEALLQRIQSKHLKEPGVAEDLYRILVSHGIVAPDGTPAGPPPSQQPAVAASAASSPSGAIWTPGSETGAGEKKIWTPGMD